MSGVYIKGMEMPKSCYKCPLRRRDGMDIVCPVAHERFSVADVNILEYRLDNCPLVPVPPHGRLIEKSALLDDCYTEYEDFMNGKIDGKTALLNIERKIKTAPTIIPAEEEGEG